MLKKKNNVLKLNLIKMLIIKKFVKKKFFEKNVAKWKNVKNTLNF